jgi:radical SAM superfamily enzyme YgiQ (UPF0313 family)
MKIVFIQPNVGFKGHTWEALGIGYLISYLKEHYKDLDVDFYSDFYDSDQQIIKGCKDADVIGFSCTSPQFKHGLSLAREVKRDNNVIVFGGIHVSALPWAALEEECIDAIVVGEGEQSIVQLIWDIQHGVPYHKKIYKAGYFDDLDSLPFPDRKTIKNERNINQAYKDNGQRITSVLSSRGCPYHCTFCCSRTLWGNRVRLRSAANILSEVEELVNDWHIDFLKFADDTFTVSKKRLLEFCRLKIVKNIRLPYGANAHVNTIDEEVLRQLAFSDCKELWYGVESGSPKILKAMKKNTNLDKVKEAFFLTRQYGIKTRAYFLLGMPQETVEDIELTEKLCDELKPDMVGFTLLAPFPCNEYYNETMKDWDWSTFDEYSNDWVTTGTLSNQALKDAQKRLVSKYQTNAVFRQKK